MRLPILLLFSFAVLLSACDTGSETDDLPLGTFAATIDGSAFSVTDGYACEDEDFGLGIAGHAGDRAALVAIEDEVREGTVQAAGFLLGVPDGEGGYEIGWFLGSYSVHVTRLTDDAIAGTFEVEGMWLGESHTVTNGRFNVPFVSTSDCNPIED